MWCLLETVEVFPPRKFILVVLPQGQTDCVTSLKPSGSEVRFYVWNLVEDLHVL